MKLALISCLLLLVLISCHNESANPELPEANPLSATYTDSSTGNQFATEYFEYTSSGKIISDAYVDQVNNKANKVTYYEYDANGNLTKEKSRITSIEVPYNITEYTYENGLKKTMKIYIEGLEDAELTEWFYNHGSLPDSTVATGEVGTDGAYTDVRIFTYDNSNHLVKQTMKYNGFSVSSEEYTYDGDHLVMSCSAKCTTNEYNGDGLLVKSVIQYGSINRITEERFYSGQRLDEKWLYVYNLGNETATPSTITKIKFQY